MAEARGASEQQPAATMTAAASMRHVQRLLMPTSRLRWSPVITSWMMLVVLFSVTAWTLGVSHWFVVRRWPPQEPEQTSTALTVMLWWLRCLVAFVFHPWLTSSAAECLFTLILLHQCRFLERLLGSWRFGSMVCLHYLLTLSLVLLVWTLVAPFSATLSFQGPHALLTSILVQYARWKPSMSFPVALGGAVLTDRWVLYIFVLQWIWAGPTHVWLLIICGVLSGLLQIHDPVALFMRPRSQP